MTRTPPRLGDAIDAAIAAIPSGLRRLTLAPWRPHRTFTGALEPITALHARLSALHAQSLYGDDEAITEYVKTITLDAIYATGYLPDVKIGFALYRMARALHDDNGLAFAMPALNRELIHNDAYTVPLRRRLDDLEPYLLHETKIRAAYERTVSALIIEIIDRDLPAATLRAITAPVEQPPPALLSVPLLALMNEPRQYVRAVMAKLIDDDADSDPAVALAFAATRAQFSRNVLTASRMTLAQAVANPARVLTPATAELPPARLADAFLAATPFQALAATPVPFVIPSERRFEHAHIVGGTGHGKTQLLQTLMLADVDDPTRPAVIAIDSQGDMIKTLSHLARFDPALDERLIILDPADTEWPLALNMFDVNRARIDKLSLGQREQILAGIIALYDYIFGALLGAELTQKQGVVFRYIARLMIEIPAANIQTLRQLMEDAAPFQPYITRLTGTTRAFFENEFADRSFNGTRQQIRRRLYGLLSNPTFERMFSHPRNAFDMKTAMDSGKIVLINTAKDVLKDEASAIFGRYMIALVEQAALERAADPETSRHPAFIYIDEAADYFDQTIDTLLIQARKFKVGLTLAHQHLDQLKPGLRASMMTNPAVRFAGGLSQKDANALDADMRTSTEFLLGMRKGSEATTFACFVRNMTANAIALQVPLGRAEQEPRMADAAYQALLARIRAQVAVPLGEVAAHIDGSAPVPRSDDDEFADRY